MDLISVIVPIYKVEAYLDRCVESIVSQTYKNLQIILVDDGSPDRCGAMCDAWAEKDSRITVIHKENGGLSDARNAGLAVATGEYISFIDSDDYIAPDFLQSLLTAMEDTGAEIAACGVAYVDEDDNVLRQRPVAPGAAIPKTETLRRLVLEDGVYQTVWNMLYRRHVIDGILFEKGKCNEDDFWTYQIFDRITALALVDQPLYYYLQRTGSIMGAGYSPKRLDGLEARHLRMTFLQKYPELAPLARQRLAGECLWHLQNVLRLPDKADRCQCRAKVLTLLRNTPGVSRQEFIGGMGQWLRYRLLRTAPVTTARLQNLLGLGL